MLHVKVKINTRDVEKRLKRLQKDIGIKVLASSINKTTAIAKTAMIKQITKKYKLKAGFVRKRIAISRARRKGANAFTAVLRGTGKRSANLIAFVESSISLAQLKKRRKADDGKEIRFQITRAGGKKTIPGSFIGNKGRTIFKRVGGSRGIAPVRTINVPQMFNTREINRAVQAIIRKRFIEVFNREVAFYISKANR